MTRAVTIALADDHVLLRNGLASLLKEEGHTVLFEASNGVEFISLIQKCAMQPDVVLMDINMPQKDGYETTQWLKEQHPLVKVLALSMYDDEEAIIRMLRCGAKGFLLKDCEPPELRAAISAVIDNGFFHSELVTCKLIHSLNKENDPASGSQILKRLSEKEIEFLKLAATELTYKEIAAQMHLSPRTVDGYRESLFVKLDVKSRVGLVLFAIKHGLVKVG
jgi:DNA-binding NarL/FixJ family response regulator